MDTALLKRLLLLVFCSASAGGIPLVNLPRVRAWMDTRNRYLIPAFYLLSRVALYVVLYIVVRAGMAGSDLEHYYYPQGNAVLYGKLPGRDFATTYSPIFPFLLALSYMPFPEDFKSAPVLLFILADLACLMLLRAFVRHEFGEEWVDRASWTFMLCPLTWVVSVHYAQDEVLVALVVMAAICLASVKRSVLAGLALGLGIVLTKATTAIVAAAFILRPQKGPRLKEIAAMLAPMLVVYGLFACLGANSFSSAVNEGFQAGGHSITSLVITAAILALNGFAINDTAAIAVVTLCPLVGIVTGAVLGRRRELPLYEFISVVMLCLLLLSPRSVGIYRAWIVCPMVVVALRRNLLWLFALWSLNAAFLIRFSQGSILNQMQPVIGVILELALLRAILRGKPVSDVA